MRLSDRPYLLIRAVRVPQQMQPFRSRDAGQLASDTPKKMEGLSPIESGYPRKIKRFGFSDDNLVMVGPLCPKQYPDRRTHKSKKPNKRKRQ